MNEAARNYGKSLRERKPTQSKFGGRKTTAQLPKPQVTPEITTEEPKPPTYDHADKQTGQADKTAEDHGEEDKAITKDKGANPEADRTVKTTFKPKESKVIENQPHTQVSTEKSIQPSNAFIGFWNLETEFDFEEEIHQELNFYTPNTLAMYEILGHTHKALKDNRFLNKHHPEYIPYGVTVYYSILFYIQILRAQTAAGVIKPSDSRFLRNFFRKYNEESLPICESLVPYFSSIVSTLLPQTKFNWIAPQIAPGLYGNGMTIATLTKGTNKPGGQYLQPLIPHMLASLRYSISETNKSTIDESMKTAGFGKDDDTYAHLDEETGEFVIANLELDGKTKMFGVDFKLRTGRHEPEYEMFESQGINQRYYQDADSLTMAGKRWRDSEFTKVKYTALDLKKSMKDKHDLPQGTNEIRDLADFVHWEQDGTNGWFQQLINNNVLFCRFGKGRTQNLSDIPTTGGMETTVMTEFRKLESSEKKGKRKVRTVTIKNFYNGTIGKTEPTWYPDTFKDLHAGFYTTRYGMKREEILQAFTFGINATLPIFEGADTDSERIGSYRNVMIKVPGKTSGSTTDIEADHRVGPYWEDGDWSFTLKKDDNTGKPMFAGWQLLIQSEHIKYEPERI